MIINRTNLDFFRARAAEAEADADAANLHQVRERFQPAQAAWQALADRAERSERMREMEAKRKAEMGLSA